MKIDFNRINVLLSCYIKKYVGLLHFLSRIIIKTSELRHEENRFSPV